MVAALSTAGGVAAQIDPDALDAAETNVCVAKTRLDGAVAGAAEARNPAVPVEQLTGEGIDDPAHRRALQRSVDGLIVGAQNGLVETFRQELAHAQAEHRRLTGSNFNTARCNGAAPRTSHRQAADKQREAQADAQLARAMQQQRAAEQEHEERLQLEAACMDREVLSLPPDAAARLFPPGYVNEARARYGEFASAFERRTGKAFDPALCP
jgi:hypothetical protein